MPDHVSCVYVRQKEALGLGHAVLCAQDIVGQEPCAVILADDLIDGGDKACLQQMVDVFNKTQQSVIAVQEIDKQHSDQYGIVAENNKGEVTGIVEKPKPENAPSKLAVVGRYILTPQIFHLLQNTKPGSGGEIQLTDAIAALLTDETIHACRFKGKRYDCGSKLGYLEATIAYALKHPELADDFSAILAIYQEKI